jgi:hypothetical protein
MTKDQLMSEIYPEHTSTIIEIDTCSTAGATCSAVDIIDSVVSLTVGVTFVPLTGDEARELAMRLTLAAEQTDVRSGPRGAS